MADILKAIRSSTSGAKIIGVMGDDNLPYDRLLVSLRKLEEKGFIKRKDGPSLYYLNKKGMDFLVEFEKLERPARAFGIEL
ncbi:MAG: hypothetical protein J7L11_03290 [Thermoprotei archaeon]|nr:hypothetical protein [Thermoprotei archaeon]